MGTPWGWVAGECCGRGGLDFVDHDGNFDKLSIGTTADGTADASSKVCVL